jgi:isoleucyl-tRNA synthetase
VLAYWEREGVPAATLHGKVDGPVFRFTEGPPTANGPPHIGHLVARILKDVQLRYRRLRGFHVISPMAGWDCHGLGVEIEIEKRHGLRSRHDIEAYGVEKFCDECRADTLRVAARWQDMSRRIGYWLDYERAYRTMDAGYIESVWWSLRSLFDHGLLEKGHYVLPYCPRCETTLSSHEVAQGYKETTDPSVTVRFPLAGPDGGRRSLLVWTTTPWTLPANLLVAARADLNYAVVRAPDGEELVLAEAALSRYFPAGAPVVAHVTGRELAGLEYRPPFDTPGPGPGRYRIVLDDFVTVEDGTGLVHVAPSFGPDDQRIGAREKVGIFDPLDSRGRFTDRVALVAGKSFKAADPILMDDLAARGLLYARTTLKHTYPFCWRCDSALLYRAMDSWFVRTSRVTERLVRHNDTVLWVPSHLKDGRFGNFLTEAKDWALSRTRYWGTPLPIWICPAGHVTCVGGFADLAERLDGPLPAPFDPHRVVVDALRVRCRTCQAPARREPYTIDAWYDSGSAPYAQFHYPFEPGPFDPAAPLDYIAEGLDQTRGWYYSLLVLSTTLFDRAAYRACLTTGLVLDESGRKMSKSKGNALEPMALLERLGGDAARWAFLSLDFTEAIRLSEAIVEKSANRTVGTLRHAVAFFLENARADGLAPCTEAPRPSGLLDRWLLSRLEATRASAESALESFDPRPAAVAVREFVDDLSTWYLRRSRPRFWGDEGPSARGEAHRTLSYALLSLARILAPLLPFVAETIHQEVGQHGYRARADSVHLTGWPGVLAPRDEPLEAAMAELRGLVEAGREVRQRVGVKARVPLPELLVFAPADAGLAPLGAEADVLLADELNVRAVRRRPAPAPGELAEDTWAVREERDRPVLALSRRPTPELIEEGLYREVARRLQQRRKELGLAYEEKVRVRIYATGPVRAALLHRTELLTREIVAAQLELSESEAADGPDLARWEFDGFRFAAEMRRASG